MQDGDKEVVHTANTVLVATTLATLVVAGSAFLWRSNILPPRHLVADSHQPGESACRVPDSTMNTDSLSLGREARKADGTPRGATTSLAVSDEFGSSSDAKDLKNSRSKERRRRGKDPLKDILKSGKKIKGLARSDRVDDAEDSGIAHNTPPQIQGSTSARYSREKSLPTSSRSVSTASTSTHRMPFPNSDEAGSYQGSSQNTQGDDGEEAAPSSASAVSHSRVTGSQDPPSLDTSDPHAPDLSLPSHEPSQTSHPQTPEFPSISLSTSSSTSHSGSNFSDVGITPNTSPALSQPEKTPTTAQVDRLPLISPRAAPNPFPTSVSAPSTRHTRKSSGSWDWDGSSTTPGFETTYRKPPRFRSKSRGSRTPMSPPFSASIAVSGLLTSCLSEPQFASSQVSSFPSTSSPLSPTSTGTSDDVSLPFTFPTLNASAGPSSEPCISPAVNNSSPPGHSTASGGHANANTPRRAPTPRRPPTPLSGTSTPPPSLSAQTQLASLRGALEAARMREEKLKAEMERSAKDLEMMRWESVTWRRREIDLQTQIHHLMNQLQAYAGILSPMSGLPSPMLQHQSSPGSNPNPNGPSNPTQNGYQFPPSSSNAHSPPPMLQIPSPAQMLIANGILSPTGMLSPMSMAHAGPHSPFYAYPSQSPHPHLQHPHSHVQQSQSPHQSNLFSMLFPHAPGASGTGSGPSSVAGSSSGGSHSPDQGGSPTPPPTLFDRGRKRTRTRTQTAGARIGERENAWDGEGGGDGWIGIGDEEGGSPFDVISGTTVEDDYSDDGDGGNDDEDGGGFSEALADAILKRPGSIRVGSKKGKSREQGGRERDGQQQTEFVFPSLSDFGNVNRGKRVSAELLRNDEVHNREKNCDGQAGEAEGVLLGREALQEGPY